MATNPVPTPVLDTRNGDQVTAQAIGSLPAELSDRSDANPAVVILEACGAFFDKLIFQINRWPAAVIQKVLSLCNITLLPAVAAWVQQTFTLTNPQQTDTVISKGTNVSTSDGSITFSTQADLTIKAYTAQTGTVTITSGSATVTGSGTSFPTDGSWTGYQIQGASGTWYTISSVASATSLTLSTTASSTQSAVAFNVGPITGTVLAQATTTGLATNVAAAALTTLTTSPAAVASTTNNAAAYGGSDAETIANAIARAPLAFATRDVVVSPSDYAYCSSTVLGQGARVVARSNYNVSTSSSGYVTVAMLSPSWTTSTPVSAQERAAVVRDLAGRTFIGSTTIDLAVTIHSVTPVVALYRKSTADSATVRVAAAGALNTYLSPAAYPWDPSKYTNGYRPIYAMDLAGIAEAQTTYVDRVVTINEIPAVGIGLNTAPAAITFTNGSATGTTANTTGFLANQSFVIDAANSQVYLVTGVSGGVSITITPSWAGSTGAVTPSYFNSGDFNLTNWYDLPYSNLSTDPTAPPSSIIVVGSV